MPEIYQIRALSAESAVPNEFSPERSLLPDSSGRIRFERTEKWVETSAILSTTR